MQEGGSERPGWRRGARRGETGHSVQVSPEMGWEEIGTPLWREISKTEQHYKLHVLLGSASTS